MVSGEPVEDLRYLFDALCVHDGGYESPDREDDGDSSPEVRRRGPLRRETAPRPCPYRHGSSDGRRSPSPDYGLPSSVDSAVSLSPPASNETAHSSGVEADYDTQSDESILEVCRILLSLPDPDELYDAIRSCLPENSPEPVSPSPELVPPSPEELPLAVQELNRQASAQPRFRVILPRKTESSCRDQEDPVSPPAKSKSAMGPQWARLHKALPVKALNQGATFVAKLVVNNSLKMRDKCGRTYVHEAVSQKKPALVYRLVEHIHRQNSCDLLDAPDYQGQTALHYACELQQYLVVGVLCAAGARRDTCDADGATPMHLAAERGCHHCIEELLAPPCPGSVNIQDNRGRTPLHRAVLSHGGQLCVKSGGKEGYVRIDCRTAVKLLTTTPSAHPHLELQDRVGETALHYAAQHHKVDLVELLLLNAEDPEALTAIANNAGDTALHMACRSLSQYRDKLVHLLLQRGASLDVPNKRGERPIDLLPPDQQLEVWGAFLQ
ncbi:uncharacterized protein LOC144136314 isoform X2 [Amblyomma americanum]